MKTASTHDVYEAAYMLLKGCELVDIEGSLVKGKVKCTLVFTGENIARYQLTYLNGDAEANIIHLRRALGQIHVWLTAAKRNLKPELLRKEQPEGGSI
jgi:hypothetical protein